MKKLFKFKNDKQVIVDVYSQEEIQKKIEEYKNSIKFTEYNDVLNLVDEEISKYEKIQINNNDFYVNKNHFECEYINAKKYNIMYFLQTMPISLIMPWFSILNYLYKNPKKNNLEEIKVNYNILYWIGFAVFLTIMIRFPRLVFVLGFYLNFISFLLPYDKLKKLKNKDFKINRNKILEIIDYNENDYITDKINNVKIDFKNDNTLNEEVKINFVNEFKNVDDYKKIKK